MNRAWRYVIVELAKHYATMAAALIVLFDLIAFMTEAEDVGDARYDIVDAIVVVLYGTPALLVDLAPFVALLGTLAAFASLDTTSEITALRAAGTSRAWFLRTAASAAVMFMLLIAAIELVARPAHLQASLLRMYETAAQGNPLPDGGFWAQSDSTYVNIEGLTDAQRPTGIRIFALDEHGMLQSYRHAERAEVQGPRQWRLESLTEKHYANGAPIRLDTRAAASWSPVWQSESDIYALTVTSLSIEQLLGRTATAATALDERVELWRRIALPIAATAYAMLACAFALTSRGRGGKAVRMAVGAAAALVLYLGEQVTVNAGILAGVPVALASLLPGVIVFGAAMALTRAAP